MSAATPFNPELVRAALQKKTPESLAEDEAIRAYVKYYSLDFAGRYPGTAHTFMTVSSNASQLAVQSFVQPGAKGNLLLVHGYFDHVGLYGHLIEYGLSRGLNVVAFDLPGHGLSSGEPAVIDSFEEYTVAIASCMEAMSELADLPWFCIAQSTGGAAVMQLLLDQPQPRFRSVVLLAPLVRPLGWWWVRILHRLLHHWRDFVPRQFAQNSQDGLFVEFLRGDPLQAHHLSIKWVGALKVWLAGFLDQPPCLPGAVCPLLIVQGTGDQTVDWRYNLVQVKRVFPDSQQVIIHGARHHLANEILPVRTRIVTELDGFFSEVLASADLAAGATQAETSEAG